MLVCLPAICLVSGVLEQCAPSEFACQQGGCIEREWVCDGDIDCEDKSDETNCSKCQKKVMAVKKYKFQKTEWSIYFKIVFVYSEDSACWNFPFFFLFLLFLHNFFLKSYCVWLMIVLSQLKSVILFFFAIFPWKFIWSKGNLNGINSQFEMHVGY